MASITVDPSEMPQAINLDCSTRAKIVIRTKLTTSKPPIAPTLSVFTPKRRDFSNNISTKPLETSVQGLQVPTNNPSQHSPRPSPLTPKMLPKSKTIEDSKIKKQRTMSHDLPTTVALPGRKIISVPSRLRISSTPSLATPTPEPEPVEVTSLPIQSTSQFAEEYDKCPCKKGRATGRSPCDRCQLMLLADKFCELIDVQCHKWGIPPKH